MPPTVAPYGTWRSPVTAELLVLRSIGLGGVELDGDAVHWSEARPSEGGRVVVVRAEPDGSTTDLLPDGFSARTQVHEYGGRCATVAGGVLVTSNWEDQRLWRIEPGRAPVPLTPAPAVARSDRYADPVLTPDRRWVVCVRERHHGDGAGHVDNDLVAVAVHPDGPPGPPVVLTAGRDFYTAPALSPDGTGLAWVCWDHPDMPWDATELWRADLVDGPDGPRLVAPTLVAGGTVSVAQPRWSPLGVLHHVSDRTGWWNVYAGDEPVLALDAECSEPGWVFGTATYGFTADGALVVTWAGPGGSGVGCVVDGTLVEIDTAFTSFTSVRVNGPAGAGGSLVAVAGSPTSAPAVVRVDLATGAVSVLRRSQDAVVDPAWLSTPERVRYPTGDGEEAWALVYPPASGDHEAPPGERPPLVVMSHGGPTSAASSVLDLRIQYWTTRGFAVADVDYRGSTGYGRAYRERLRGEWGVLDVEDCAAVARWLAEEGRSDPARSVIRGGSAGGFTTLAALAFTDAFAAGASLYGVADLELLARDTHKFESRYLDRLVGPWPAAADTYQARSPIHHLDGFTCPIVLFQGSEDAVVPPAQSEMIHAALRDRGIPVAYLAFAGEQHGFRRAETIRRVAETELSFYGRVLGFVPDGAVPVAIDNVDAIHTATTGSAATADSAATTHTGDGG